MAGRTVHIPLIEEPHVDHGFWRTYRGVMFIDGTDPAGETAGSDVTGPDGRIEQLTGPEIADRDEDELRSASSPSTRNA